MNISYNLTYYNIHISVPNSWYIYPFIKRLFWKNANRPLHENI